MLNADIDAIIELYLGPVGTPEDAEKFFDTATDEGFEWDEDNKKFIDMSETEWQRILSKAFNE